MNAVPTGVTDPIDRDTGRGAVLLLDAFSGIAGDMTVSALVDLGVPVAVVSEAVAALGLPGVRAELSSVRVGAIGATSLEVIVESPQPERSHAEIDRLLAEAPLELDVSTLARRIFQRLAEAEARVHRVPVERVHFHEVGAVDAIVDILGAAACLTYLGARVVVTPLPMGRGFVETRHGRLPVPAPATVECLAGVPTYDAGIDVELVTPTGAAIVGVVASEFLRWPSFAPQRVGWGAGTRRLPDRPNVLRAVLGAPTEGHGHGSEGTHVLLEANVDDLTGELAAHALERLRAAGALDAWAAPITMKKGRPGLLLSALAPQSRGDAVAHALLHETTSIGLRRTQVSRVERPRRIIEVQTRFGSVPVKVSEGPFGPAQVKPEFDVCVRLADEHQVPVREVLGEAAAAARQSI